MIQFFVYRVFRATQHIDYSFIPLGPYSSPYIAAYVLENQEPIIGYAYMIGEKQGVACTYIYEN